VIDQGNLKFFRCRYLHADPGLLAEYVRTTQVLNSMKEKKNQPRFRPFIVFSLPSWLKTWTAAMCAFTWGWPSHSDSANKSRIYFRSRVLFVGSSKSIADKTHPG
jgi:hypothetical protein